MICATLATCIIFMLLAFVLYRGYLRVYALWEFSLYGVPYKPPTPIIGNLGKLIKQQVNFFTAIKEFYNLDKNARFVFFYNGPKRYIIVRDPELIKSVLVTNFEKFPDHPSTVQKDLDPVYSNNILNLCGSKWRHCRKTLSGGFSSKYLKNAFSIFEEHAENFVSWLSEKVPEEGLDMDWKDTYSRYSHDLISDYSFGEKSDSLRNPENEFYVRVSKGIDLEGGPLSGRMMMNTCFPFLAKLFKIRLFDTELNDYFVQSLTAAIKERDRNSFSRPDFLQYLMNLRGTANEMSMLEMASNALGFYLGSMETNCVLLTFLTYQLALNQDVQQKLRKEIDDILEKSNGVLTLESVKELKYMDAVIMETSRLYPSVVVTDRLCEQEFNLGPAVPGKEDYVVQPGERLWLPLGMISIDEKYHRDPEKFLPDRFFNRSKTEKGSPFYPFSAGPRMCMGDQFALLFDKVTLVHLLRTFEIVTCQKTHIPMVYSPSCVMLSAKGGCWIKFKKFSSSRKFDNPQNE